MDNIQFLLIFKDFYDIINVIFWKDLIFMVLGIIAEYNPFHNGHLYHILKSKELTKDDYVVAVIGGNFTQRGESSVLWHFFLKNNLEKSWNQG